MEKKRLVILDGHSVAFRAFYALDPNAFKTKSGEYTNAVYGFMNMLIRLVEEAKPSHIAVAFDLSRHSFRTEEYPEYKGTRTEAPIEFRGQVERVQQLLEVLGIRWLTRENYEADDIVATLATRAENSGFEVLIASGDRDTFQLVSDAVTVLYPGSSMADLRYMTPAAVAEKYQVPPKRYPELAALVGEASDNLPGVPLVGPKTAAQWITQYDGLENLLARADEIGGKRAENLRAHIEDVRRNRRLNHLVTDLDLQLELDELIPAKLDRIALAALCDELNFGRIRTRLLKIATTQDAPAPQQDIADQDDTVEQTPETELDQLRETFPSDFVVLSNSEGEQKTFATKLSDWLRAAAAAKRGVALVVQGRFNPGEARADGLALYYEGNALEVDLTRLDGDAEAHLREFLAKTRLYCYDAKALSHALIASGYRLNLPAHDLQLWDYVSRTEADNDLEKTVRHYLQKELQSEPADLLDSGQSFVKEAETIWQLAQVMAPQLSHGQRRMLLEQIEEPTQELLLQMEADGIAIAQERLAAQWKDFDHQVQAAIDKAAAYTDGEVNLSSPKQLQQVLFEDLGMPKTKKTKTGYTTNFKALQELLAKTDHPFLHALMEHRESIKLRQIIEGLQRATGDDGRIHTTFKQTVTATGRLSSADPNLQNIPARTQAGRQIRAGFVPGPGFSALLTADYAQIEMRIMAHLSEDAALIEAFDSGEDLHTTMAAMVFDVPVNEVDSQLRSRVKATSYGLAYGLSAYGLSQQLQIPVPEAKKLSDRYFQRFGHVREYLHSVVATARQRGYTETMMGRRRYLPELESPVALVRQNAERAALNAPIQGTAADIIKVAMINVGKALREADAKSRLLLQVHDELVLEVAEGEEEQLTQLVREAMSNPVELAVPLEVSIGVGESWLDAAH